MSVGSFKVEPNKRASMIPVVAAGWLILALSSTMLGQAVPRSGDISPIGGESWLTHLQRPFSETSMGKTGALGPAPSLSGDDSSQWYATVSERAPHPSLPLDGSDLYRFNCQGCHGEHGLGAPPEIRPVINPVRATSAVLVSERMKSTGMDITRAQAAELAVQARTSLTQRLQRGGEDMPAFGYLRNQELRSLNAYLEELADVPGHTQSTVEESPLRVGELIVKSTCHICHDASGVNPTPEQILQGAIPPLSTLTHRTSEAQFIRKVTHGSPITMGTPPMPQRGRMPVFYYLSEDEAADVYSYLNRYPPGSGVHEARLDTPSLLAASWVTGSVPATTRTLTEGVDSKSVVLMIALGALVVLLLSVGAAVTIREFRRLSAQAQAKRPATVRYRVREMSIESGGRRDAPASAVLSAEQ